MNRQDMIMVDYTREEVGVKTQYKKDDGFYLGDLVMCGEVL